MNLNTIIFSYNRALQLDGVLQSLILHCFDISEYHVSVLFKADPEHSTSYQTLQGDYAIYDWIDFIKETDFHQDLVRELKGFDYILFLVDDNIFVQDFVLKDLITIFKSQKKAIGFSLRLGKNTTYCYTLNKEQSLPVFSPIKPSQFFTFNWVGSDHDFGYPLEVSSSIYRTEVMLKILSDFRTHNPNNLELILANQASKFVNQTPELVCPKQSITFCVPVNKVQTVVPDNRAGEFHPYSAEELKDLFNQGYRINVRKYHGFTPNACHQEVPILFYNPSNKRLLEPLMTGDLHESFPLRKELSDLIHVMQEKDHISISENAPLKSIIYDLNWSYQDRDLFIQLELSLYKINAVHGIQYLDDLLTVQHEDWRFASFSKDNWDLVDKYLSGNHVEGPLVSVVMPVYNGEQFLSEAIDSILNQTFKDFEFIIVDDGSTDKTAEIIRSYKDDRIVYCKNEKNSGIVKTLNLGLALARGKYIARADADDISLPERLKIQTQYMESNPNIMLYGSSMIIIDEEEGKVLGEEIVPVVEEQIIRRLMVSCSFVHPSVIMRRDIIQKAGGYLSDRPHAEDYDLWCRMSLNFEEGLANYEKSLVRYRVNNGGVSNQNQLTQVNSSLLIGWQYLQRKTGTALAGSVYKGLYFAWLGDWQYWNENCLNECGLFFRWIKKEPIIQSRWKSFFKSLEHFQKTGKNKISRFHNSRIPQNNNSEFRVVAIMSAYNEADVIHYVIKDLIDQGISVYFIDHHSTDETVKIVSQFLGKGVIKIETFPEDSGFELPKDVYAWRYILQRKEDIVKSLGPGWYLHIDADEFRESPWLGISLYDGLKIVDSQGYNAVEFSIFDFKPVNNDFIPGSDVRKALRYYSQPNHQSDTVQLKCWKYYGQDFNLWRSGGHIIEFKGRCIFPIPFIMRHYPIRSQQHGMKKVFSERKNRFDIHEKSNQWHAQYDQISNKNHQFIKNPRTLQKYDGKTARQGLKSNPGFRDIKKQPLVSIIIPVFNKLELTHMCIKSIFQYTAYDAYEIIVVNNNSTDGTTEYLVEMEERGVNQIILEDNLGFTRACNIGASKGKGDYLLFLNNDTEVTPGWLTSMVKLMQARDDAGAVGSKLIYPDGKLQEAGGIIFSDGAGWNYGRGFSPDDPRFDFVREVDYCSGASLLVRKDTWEKIGGFDEQYAPAYYEDADLCFSIRQVGLKVFYQPESRVIHKEGQTAGTNTRTGYKHFQVINQRKFFIKWSGVLKHQYNNNPKNVVPASERGTVGNIIIFDPFLPIYDRASGSLRLFHMIKLLKKLGFHVTFISRNGKYRKKYQPIIQQSGIETYARDIAALRYVGINKGIPDNINYKLLFSERRFDYAIIDFWEMAAYYIPLIRHCSPATKIMVDTLDIHFLRELREAKILKSKTLKKKALNNKHLEIAVYRKADAIITVTEEDKRQIGKYLLNKSIYIIPNIHKKVMSNKMYESSTGLLFVGNFNHRPNHDAIQYFVTKIYPGIKNSIPDIILYIVGNNPTTEIEKLASDDVIVTGYVEDLSPYLQLARISVNPLRFGAGMKGKIGEALSWGLPVVTTSIGAEGMRLKHGVTALIADDNKEFAQEVIRLYNDKNLWKILSDNGRELVKQQWSPERLENVLRGIFIPRQNYIPTVSIILLTYNALVYTKICIESIMAHTRLPFELIIVDNNSADGTKSYLKKLQRRYENVQIIFNKENRGFGAGNNQGAEVAKGQYLLFLNNDVLVYKNWLETLVASIEKDDHIGLVGPITNYISGRQMVKNIPYADDNFVEFAKAISIQNKEILTPRRRLAGYAMLTRKTDFFEIGGFDESLGTGNFEDDDLCIRYREKGFILMCDESVFIHHYGSQTFKANNIDYSHSLKEKGSKFREKWPDLDYDELLEIKNPLDQMLLRLQKEAISAFAEQRYEDALHFYKNILREDPLSKEAKYGELDCLFHMKRFPEALVISKKILNDNPADIHVLFLTGKIIESLGKIDSAMNIYKKIIQFAPNHHQAQDRLSALQKVETQSIMQGKYVKQALLSDHP